MENTANKIETPTQTMGQSVAESITSAPEISYSEAARRAIQNSIKVMDGRYGGAFYVKFILDVGTKYGWLNLLIVYPDGDYKSVILYKNAFKETDTESGNGVCRFKDQKGYNYVFMPWDGPGILNNHTSLTQYEIPTMPIPEVGLWKKIVENYSKIPVSKMNQTASLEQLCEELQTRAAERAKEYNQGFMDEADRCYISTDDFREIVEANGWHVSQARTKMDMEGYFDKDSGSRGYQKSKRVGSEVKRFYVIKKDPNVAGVPPKSLENTEYNLGYQTKEESDRKHDERVIRELTDKYNDLLHKYEPDAEPLC